MKIKNNDAKFIAHCEENDKKTLKESLKPNTNTTILIGPEGDFSKKEIQMALDNEYLPISLGNTRLRTETAAIIACSQVAFVNES
jgi:16S rRNA (uracil1498-N3)-methyltransferase